MVETEVILDERIFTLNCALNLYGFDTKNVDEYHEVRREIRKSLKNMKITDKELKKYIDS